MTFNTPYTFKMRTLVWQPVMFGQNVDFITICQKLEMTEISVTIQANIIIIKYCLLKIIAVPRTYFVTVRIVTFPAGKSALFELKMHAGLVVFLYRFKTELCKFVVAAMAI